MDTHEAWASRFASYAARKTREAESAQIPGYRTNEGPHVTPDLEAVGNAWSHRLFDGPFYVRRAHGRVPSVGLVLVQSRDGNTLAEDPATLGGGLTDKHVVYEGLSRVAADAVLAGARTVDRNVFFSVWHPELVSLRLSLGKPRHPAQAIVTADARLDLDSALIANVPDAPLFLLTTQSAAARLASGVRDRPWVRIVECGDTVDLVRGLIRMRTEFGLEVVSAVGGLRTARSLVEVGVVSDLYLTTSAVPAGEPDSTLRLPDTVITQIVLSKAGQGEETGVRFEHWSLRASPASARSR
jgi:riboflavin biosynthesis pyrimidine reductase